MLFERLRRTTRFDLIHQLNPVVAGMSMFLGSTGVPIVLGPIPPSWPSHAGQRGVGKRLFKQFVRNRQFASAAAIIVPTWATLAELPDDDRIRAKVQQVNYGIDAELFSPTPYVTPAPTEARSILFFANLMRRKGIFTLLSAFEQVARELNDVRLVIAGAGPDEAEVSQAVARHAHSNRIAMIGRVTRAQAPSLLRASTIYCLPSYGEPFGMTALEAMACGRPVVATDAGGLGALIPAEGGRKVPPGDAGALAGALVEVLASHDLQESMGRVNRSIVEHEYAWDRVIPRLESVYQGVVRGHLPERDGLGTAARFEVEQ
jgi:glycosyltransferase involved in cell wall biosynthesis